jgi:hypothetical protein
MNLAKPATLAVFAIVLVSAAQNAHAQRSRDDVIAAMKPFAGKVVSGVDCSTLTGKVMCGYQGWFCTPDDGARRGWVHYGRGGRFEPGSCCIDLWPDVSELDDDEKVATPFRHANDSVAHVFSSHNAKTVERHFQWMRDYGIDGAFVQRFAVETMHSANFHHCNTVMAHCRAGANAHGRAYAVMYDLSGLRRGQMQHVIDDWKLLVDNMQIARGGKDQAYLQHAGKPVVAVWGVGFSDDRSYTLDECWELVRFLKDDKKYGGCTVMLGVPTYWRTLDRDAVNDKKLHEVIRAADIVSPWAVGRFNTPDDVRNHAGNTLAGDVAWCRERKLDFLPVVFPGFSWHNMNPRAKLNQIPRRKGEFLWTQYAAAKKAGATMLYTAMFDELDEGTAIFKCTNQPPVGESRFVDYEGLPSDHYLWLTGQGGRLMRGEIDASKSVPPRELLPASGQEP